MCLNNLSNKCNHFMTYHQKKIKTSKQFFEMILFILLRKIVLINWDCWKLLDFNLFIVGSSDFILYSWIYLFLCWVYPAHDSMKCRLLLLFCDHKKTLRFNISTRSVRLTFCFPLSGSVLFYVNKILNKVYLEHWFSSQVHGGLKHQRKLSTSDPRLCQIGKGCLRSLL